MRALTPSPAPALGALIVGSLFLLMGCGTELVELATLDAGSSPRDSGVVDTGVSPPIDTGVIDLGFPDLGLSDADEDAGPDSGADTGVVDTGVTPISCACLLRCSTDPECVGIDPTSTCLAGYCSVPPASPGCTTDSDCAARATCMTVAEPLRACP